MRRFRVSYLRTAYMAIDIAAETADEAWARLETLAACEPLACDCGERLGPPRYRVIDVIADGHLPVPRLDAPPVPDKPPLDVGPVRAPELFYKMIARQGIDLAGGWSRGLEAMIQVALQSCNRCAHKTACESWLKRRRTQDYPGFCPNAGIIEACRILDPQAPPLASQASGLAAA